MVDESCVNIFIVQWNGRKTNSAIHLIKHLDKKIFARICDKVEKTLFQRREYEVRLWAERALLSKRAEFIAPVAEKAAQRERSIYIYISRDRLFRYVGLTALSRGIAVNCRLPFTFTSTDIFQRIYSQLHLCVRASKRGARSTIRDGERPRYNSLPLTAKWPQAHIFTASDTA